MEIHPAERGHARKAERGLRTAATAGDPAPPPSRQFELLEVVLERSKATAARRREPAEFSHDRAIENVLSMCEARTPEEADEILKTISKKDLWAMVRALSDMAFGAPSRKFISKAYH